MKNTETTNKQEEVKSKMSLEDKKPFGNPETLQGFLQYINQLSFDYRLSNSLTWGDKDKGTQDFLNEFRTDFIKVNKQLGKIESKIIKWWIKNSSRYRNTEKVGK